MSTLFTFPGQGAQQAGMLHELPQVETVRDCIAEASDTLGVDVLTLDDEADLQSTVSAQLCLLVAGVAMARCLSTQAMAPDAVAGLSVGAYAAAVVASVISYPDALRLVRRRAELMESAYPVGYGMTAILGLTPSALAPLMAQVHSAASPVYLANINAPTQLVVAGAKDAMERVAALARLSGAHAAKPIAIAVPSHCELLAEPAAALAVEASRVPARAPRLRYYSASLGREQRDGARIVSDLANNMAVPVRWYDTSVLAWEHGARLAVEMPPGHVLTQLSTSDAFAEGVAVAAGETRVDTVLELMAREFRRENER